LTAVVFLAVLAVLVAVQAADQKTLTSFNHFVKTPWADINTGGRLTEREIAYIAQSGYKALLSVVVFSTNDTSYNGVNGSYPSSEYEASIAKGYGMTPAYIASSLTADSAREISALMSSLPRPLFVHCHVGWTATLMTEMHLYLTQQIAGDQIISNGFKYGWDFQSNADAVAMINAVTGLSYTAQGEVFEQTLAQGEYSYKYYYWTHRAGESDYWFNAGQILDTHVASIQAAGYKSVISFRQSGEPTNRLPTDPQTGAVDNHEFSDQNGNYDVKLEQAAFEGAGLSFSYLPINGTNAADWTVKKYHEYKPVLQAAAARGPVLTHCKSGLRAAAYALTYVADTTSKCADWVVQESANIGIIYTEQDQLDFFRKVLRC